MCGPLLVALVFGGGGPGVPFLEVGLTSLVTLARGPPGSRLI